jgi:chromatin segregation and condensation protein Rec8/ScpA/Scc1 (kleisin family)
MMHRDPPSNRYRGDGQALEHFLPEQAATAGAGDPPVGTLRLSSAWASTFSASLELAKLGAVVLAQAELFAPVQVSCPTQPAP